MKKITLLLVLLLTACAPVIFTPTLTATEAPATASPSPTNTSEPNPTPAPEICTVTTGAGNQGALNLRTGPGTQYNVIRVLIEGEVLTVTSRGAWLGVVTEQTERGYINANYCKG